MFSRKLLLIVYCICIFRFSPIVEGQMVHISIVYACDDNYVVPTIVSMESAMMSKKDISFYEFTILVPGEFKSKSKERFEIFKNKYNEKCTVNIVNMKAAFNNCYGLLWGKTMYYRLDIPWLLQDNDKAIYLDGDTLVCRDLQELWDVELGDNLCGGVIDSSFNRWKDLKKFNKNCDIYINSGVLLINCRVWRSQSNIRNDINGYSQRVKENKFIYPDQDIINVICGGMIKKLPIKFMRLNTPEYLECNYEESEYASKFYTKGEFLEGKNNPVIVHYLGDEKPWLTHERIPKRLYDEWHKVFNIIKKEYRFRMLKVGSKLPIKDESASKGKSSLRCCCSKRQVIL